MPFPRSWVVKVVLRAAPILALFAFIGCGSGSACGKGTDPNSIPTSNLSGSCQQENWRCGTNTDCCGTLTCNANKVCSGGICQGAGTSCAKTADCCGTLSCSSGGYCQ